MTEYKLVVVGGELPRSGRRECLCTIVCVESFYLRGVLATVYLSSANERIHFYVSAGVWRRMVRAQ